MLVSEQAVQAAEEAVYARHERGFLMKPLVDPIDMRAALTAALPFLQGVKVKALEWPAKLEINHVLEVGIARYRLINSYDEVYRCSVVPYDDDAAELCGNTTLEAAKAAAQTDYDARVMSLIEASSDDTGQAITRRGADDLRELAEEFFIEGSRNWPEGLRISLKAMGRRILSAIEPAPSPLAPALEEATLERSIERWRGMKPSEVMKGSTAQITYALEDARKDILTLYAALSSQTVADKPWYLVMPERDPFAAGFEARQDDVDENNNPFNYGTDNAGDWNAGWESADYEISQSTDQPVADGWLPIETVPKDGTAVLVHFLPNEVPSLNPLICAAYWQKSDGLMKPGFWRVFHSVGPSFTPTHWRPLPASPGASEQSDAEAISENYLQEIQDGAWGDNGRTRGLARDRLKATRPTGGSDV